MIVVHGGSNSPEDWSDGCREAADAGAAALQAGGTALDAAIAAVRVMEDDGRFNAGRGSVLRLDGRSLEMDAAIMDSAGRLGAVAALRGFANPVLVARAVADTPHLLLAGEGAAGFASRRGMRPLEDGPSEASLARHARILRILGEGSSRRPAWRDADLEAIWNFREPMPEELRPGDTVGAVARDRQGFFAVAASSGGAVPMLLGRVGDTPLPGCGFWAGPHGAVASTGVGEEIIRRCSAVRLHDRLSAGASCPEAVAESVAQFPAEISYGVVAITARGHAVGSNRSMAHAIAVP